MPFSGTLVEYEIEENTFKVKSKAFKDRNQIVKSDL